MKLPDYSVLMSVYKKDNADFFKTSLDSIINQTHRPSEIVLVQDGPIPSSLEHLINNYRKDNPTLIRYFSFESNQGLGKVLAFGIEKCSFKYIARMDADDYCKPERCQKELEYLLNHPEIEVVGTNVEEFMDDINNVVAHVVLPETHDDIYSFAKKRNPIRHPSLMFTKDAILRCGNYRPLRFSQDYCIIVQLMMAGSKAYNIQEPLTYMRVTKDFYKRRSGKKYFMINYNLNKWFKEQGFYSFSDFWVRTSCQFVSCFMPNSLRELLYNKMLRK